MKEVYDTSTGVWRKYSNTIGLLYSMKKKKRNIIKQQACNINGREAIYRRKTIWEEDDTYSLNWYCIIVQYNTVIDEAWWLYSILLLNGIINGELFCKQYKWYWRCFIAYCILKARLCGWPSISDVVFWYTIDDVTIHSRQRIPIYSIDNVLILLIEAM